MNTVITSGVEMTHTRKTLLWLLALMGGLSEAREEESTLIKLAACNDQTYNFNHCNRLVLRFPVLNSSHTLVLSSRDDTLHSLRGGS